MHLIHPDLGRFSWKEFDPSSLPDLDCHISPPHEINRNGRIYRSGSKSEGRIHDLLGHDHNHYKAVQYHVVKCPVCTADAVLYHYLKDRIQRHFDGLLSAGLMQLAYEYRNEEGVTVHPELMREYVIRSRHLKYILRKDTPNEWTWRAMFYAYRVAYYENRPIWFVLLGWKMLKNNKTLDQEKIRNIELFFRSRRFDFEVNTFEEFMELIPVLEVMSS